MLYHVVVFALVFRTTSSQLFRPEQECDCQVPSNFRTRCLSNRYATNRQQCQASGCCWEDDFSFVLGGNCYTKNSRYCRQRQDVCQPAYPLQPCVNLGPFYCESQGCCYDVSTPPYCFRKKETSFFPTATTASPVSQWSEWSGCSQSCSPGVRTRTRQCLTGTPELCINRGYRLSERVSCNNVLCIAWGPWIYGPCSVTCGIGVASISRSCIDSGATGQLACFSSSERCERNACTTTKFTTFIRPTFKPVPTPTPVEFASWGQWQSWSACDKKCATGRRTRTRRCIFRGRRVNSLRCANSFGPISSTETSICNINMCNSWTNWSPYGRCSLTCGRGSFKYSSRSCRTKISSDHVTKDFVSCSRRQIFCNLPLCPSHLMRSSTFRTTTPPSVQTTTRQTIVPTVGRFRPPPNTGSIFEFTFPSSIARTTLSTKTTETTIPTTSKTTTPTTTISTTSATTSTLTSSTAPTATPTTMSTTTSTTTITTATEAPTTVVKMVASWQSWLEWSDCSSSCSPGNRVRVRICAYSSGDQVIDDAECGGEGPIQDVQCNENLCNDWSVWSVASCTVTCKSKDNEIPGFQAQSRHCLVDEKEEAQEDCYIIATLCNTTKPCEEPTTSPPPTQTMAPTTLPDTTTVPSTSAPTTEGSTTTTTTTTTDSTTETVTSVHRSTVWAQWGDWSDCSSPCSAGIQSRARRCLPGVAPQFCVEGAVDSRSCNSGVCSSWSGWKTEQCDKTCGSEGKQSRRRICLSGQITNDTPESCYKTMEACDGNLPACKETSSPSPKRVSADPKLDILFLVDSSNYVDDCDIVEGVTNLKRPIRGDRINETIAPTYTRMKKFMTDFINGWGGISDDGTRISIQLFSNLCSPRTKSNLHVEKKFSESHEKLTNYIKELPYLCGDYWLDWALQCAISPVMTTSFGDRKDVPNVVVAILSNAPTTSQPSDTLLRLILRRLTSGSTVMSATATQLSTLSPKSRARYEKNTRKLACSTAEKCSSYLGSIWNVEKNEVAELVRAALRDAGRNE